MKLLMFVGLAGYAAAFVLERGVCTADNCLRALTGTGSNGGTARPVIAKADCSSYLSTLVYATVTPSTLTTTTVTTTTVSTTSTSIQTAVTTAEDVITITPPSTTTTVTDYTTTYTTDTYNYKRQVTESNTIPTYASACSGAVRYSSACSCFGVFPTTSTSTILVTPTVTATSTTTLTISFAETDTTTQTTTDTTTTTIAAPVATATVDAINFCGVVGRCQIGNSGFTFDGDCQAYAQELGGLSYSTYDFFGTQECFVYDVRIEDPACEFSSSNGGLSYDIDC